MAGELRWARTMHNKTTSLLLVIVSMVLSIVGTTVAVGGGLFVNDQPGRIRSADGTPELPNATLSGVARIRTVNFFDVRSLATPSIQPIVFAIA